MCCTTCGTSAFICDCWEKHCIESCPCKEEPLVKGGQGRSAEQLLIDQENLMAMTMLFMVVVVGILVVIVATVKH